MRGRFQGKGKKGHGGRGGSQSGDRGRGRSRKAQARGDRGRQGDRGPSRGYSAEGGKTYKGRVQKNKKGFAFIIPLDTTQKDAYVPRGEARALLNGDLVEYRVHREGDRLSAEIKKVIERGQTKILGQVRSDFRGQVFETPDGEIYEMEAERYLGGQWAIAEILAPPTSRTPAVVVVREELGQKLSPKQDYTIAINEFGLPEEFSPQAIEYAEKIRPEAMQEMKHPSRGRKDLRHLDFVTIDGEDAKDFDDAVYVERHDKGFTLYVAIADVAFFVRAGSPLDRDALQRSTSVYFPGFCLPMLPESLSNDLCSLRPKEDKLSLTAEIQYDRHGNVLDTRFYESVIKTKARLTYTLVHEFIEQNAETRAKLKDLEAPLKAAYLLYRELDKQRKGRGVLDFDLGETAMTLDQSGRPTKVFKAPRYESHKLIEEFMIAANSAVAKALRDSKTQALYRIHETPEIEQLEEINQLSKSLGVSVMLHEASPKAFAAVLAASHGIKGSKVLHTMILRAQKQARYEPDPKGHFGLALRDYTHFTSPIRRYPDLVVHRALKRFILKRKDTDNKEEAIDYAALGELTSSRERRAMEAERFVNRRKQCWFMEPYVGDEFEGIISGVIEKGIFVELGDLAIEGFLPIDSLDGHFEFDERRMCHRKRPGHTVLAVGDEIRVTVESVSVNDGEITLASPDDSVEE